MVAKRVTRAITGFFGTVLLGTCLFAVPCAVGAGWQAWRDPENVYRKQAPPERPVLARTTEGFCGGAFIGGMAGAIVGAGVAAKRLLSADQSPRESKPRHDL